MTRLRLPMGALLAVAALAVVPAVPVRAQVFIPAPAPAAQASKRVCVDAEMNGAVALSYDCLNQQLAPTAAASAAGSASNAAEGLATAPSNKVGTFNYSAESIRFGSNWGKSVEPQRPPPVQTAPLR